MYIRLFFLISLAFLLSSCATSSRDVAASTAGQYGDYADAVSKIKLGKLYKGFVYQYGIPSAFKSRSKVGVSERVKRLIPGVANVYPKVAKTINKDINMSSHDKKKRTKNFDYYAVDQDIIFYEHEGVIEYHSMLLKTDGPGGSPTGFGNWLTNNATTDCSQNIGNADPSKILGEGRLRSVDFENRNIVVPSCDDSGKPSGKTTDYKFDRFEVLDEGRIILFTRPASFLGLIAPLYYYFVLAE